MDEREEMKIRNSAIRVESFLKSKNANNKIMNDFHNILNSLDW